MVNEYRYIDLGEEWRMLIISSAVSESYAQLFSEHKTNELLLKLRELGFITDDEPKVHSQLMREIKTLWNDISEDDRKLIIKYSCEVNKIMKIYRIKVFTKEDNIKEVTEDLARKVRYYAKVIALNDYGRIIGGQFIIDIHKWELSQKANRGHVIIYDDGFSQDEIEEFLKPMGTNIDFYKEPLFIKLDNFKDIVSKYEEYFKNFIKWINQDLKELMNNLDSELKELERLENEEMGKIKNYYDNLKV